MMRRDFFEIVEYSIANNVGVKFSTNGTYIDAARPAGWRRWTTSTSSSASTALTRRPTTRCAAPVRMRRSAGRWTTSPTPASGRSRSVGRRHPPQRRTTRRVQGADRRATALSCGSPGSAPSGRGADTWHELHPTQDQQATLYHWLSAHGEDVLTGDSFFHLNALGPALPGLNLCGAGRVVCLIDPVGDVYACPFVIHDEFLAGSVRDHGGFAEVWKRSDLFLSLREPESAGACASCGSYDACQGGCMAAKFFTGLPLDGPDPECVTGHGAPLVAQVIAGSAPRPSLDHSKPTPIRLSRKPVPVPYRSPGPDPADAHHRFGREPRLDTDHPRSDGSVERFAPGSVPAPAPAPAPAQATGGLKPSGITRSSGDSSPIEDLPRPSIVESIPDAEHVEHVLDAGLTVGRQPPQVGTADHHRLGSERQRLDHVAAAADPAVHHDVDPARPTAATTSGSTRIEAGAPSRLFPPWFDTEIAATPASTARRASSARPIPLTMNGPPHSRAQPGDVVPGRRRRTHPRAVGLEETRDACRRVRSSGTPRSGSAPGLGPLEPAIAALEHRLRRVLEDRRQVDLSEGSTGCPSRGCGRTTSRG